LGGGVGGGGGLREKQHFKMEGIEKWKKNCAKQIFCNSKSVRKLNPSVACVEFRCTIPGLLPLKLAFDFQALKVCNIFFLEIS